MRDTPRRTAVAHVDDQHTRSGETELRQIILVWNARVASIQARARDRKRDPTSSPPDTKPR